LETRDAEACLAVVTGDPMARGKEIAMTAKGRKILVVGAGAIGGVTGALVSRAGHDVRILEKNPLAVERIRSSGLTVFTPRGNFSVSPPVFAEATEIPESVDVILLATKATSLPGVVLDLKPLMKPGTVIVSLQNGLCEEVIAGAVGRDAVIGCVVGWGATLHEPGVAEMTSKGDFILGRLDGRTDEALLDVQEIRGAAAPAEISSNIMGHLYAKLIINSCITTLGAVCGLCLGEMLRLRKARNMFIGIARESMDVARAMDTRVEAVAGLDFGSFVKGAGPLSGLKRHALIRLVGFKHKRLKSSSLQSLERGERTEIDFFNGFIAAKGRELGVKTPLNDFLTALVKDIETGERKIGPENFDDPFLEAYR
jgi:2-dehydropantoate 2-reductase